MIAGEYVIANDRVTDPADEAALAKRAAVPPRD